MDVPVEATIHLNPFQDETKVRGILRSHGFQLTDLDEGRLHVRGYFFELKAVKVRLEQLIEQQTKAPLRSPSPSSGAISKYYSNDNRSRSQSREKPPHASPSSPSSSSAAGSKPNRPASQENRAAASSPPDQHASLRNGHETVVVDADVFRYAERLRKRDVESILKSHSVRMKVRENSSSSTITLQGRSSESAAGELQKLLDDLSRSLRTQEVPLRDVDQDGRALLEEIQRNRNVSGSVLVCEMEDRLHLVGPSGESYEVKQRLLGRKTNPPGRTGRTSDRSLRNRSSSLPPNRESSTKPPPGGAAGSNPPKNPEEKQEAADVHPRSAASRRRSNSEPRVKNEPERGGSSNRPPGGAAGSSSSRNQEEQHGAAAGRSGGPRRRSPSEPRVTKEPDGANDIELETENRVLPSKPHRNFIQRLLGLKFIPRNIKQKFKRKKRR